MLPRDFTQEGRHQKVSEAGAFPAVAVVNLLKCLSWAGFQIGREDLP